MLLTEISAADDRVALAAPLARDVVLVTLAAGAPATMLPFPAAPPYGTLDVDGAQGPWRIAAARLTGDRQDDPAPGLPALYERADLDGIAALLDPPSKRRLLGFLLGFCRSAFSLSDDPDFVEATTRLALCCCRDGGAARVVATASAAWMVLAGVTVTAHAELYILGPRRIRLSAAPVLQEGDPGQHAAQLIEPLQPGDRLLSLADPCTVWTIARDEKPLPDLLRPASRSPAVIGGLRASCLRALARARSGPELLREMQVLAPATPRRHADPAQPVGGALDLVLPDGAGRLFLRGWLRDPLNLVAGAAIRTSFGQLEIAPESLHRVRRTDVTTRYQNATFRDDEPAPGFVAHIPDPADGHSLQPSLQLRLRSGTTLDITAPAHHLPAAMARDAVLSSVPPDDATPAIFDACLAPAAAAFHRQAMERHREAERVPIGQPLRQPMCSIIIPLYRNLSFLRFQFAALAQDSECRRCELIFVLDSPEQRRETEHLLRGLHLLHGMPLLLLVMPRNLGYAAANNVAAGAARAASLLLLNSDVIPLRPGWLGAMRSLLAAKGVGGVGPKLLFDDESIQHAGLYFVRDTDAVWFNAHYHKGMPRRWPAAARRRRVPGVTGAALLVHRALFEAVGGLCEDYIIGDYEDSDFCLRLRAAGTAIVYTPEAELFHFERKSIRLHAGYARTLASLYNRRLHHRRWDAAIDDLMALPEAA